MNYNELQNQHAATNAYSQGQAMADKQDAFFGPTTMPAEIAAAILAVMEEVGYVQKKGTNTFHNYKFTAVGDLLAKVQPAMVGAGLVIVQSELRHGPTFEGRLMEAEYEFELSHKSGVTWRKRPIHTGTASASNAKGGVDDKALNKCHTAARKYFLMALFQIPTGEAVDPDEQEDIGPANDNRAGGQPRAANVSRGKTRAPEPPPAPEQPPAASNDNDDWQVWIDGFKEEFSQQATYTTARELWNYYQTVLQNMKEKAPVLYSGLLDWVKTEGDKLPKVGG